MDLTITASGGYVDVVYNGVPKAHVALDIGGCYFKAGCYVQSNTSTGDLATSYGEVEIASLVIEHT
jgi:poly(beta-D-mannuronate) lyase